MTQKEKKLLLIDLCARLPYITYYDLSYYGHKTRAVLQEFITTKDPLKSLVKVNTVVEPIPYENIKPYLRPMSSMTEEEYKSVSWEGCSHTYNYSLKSGFRFVEIKTFTLNILNWLNANHFDYRGLIEKGLALEAPKICIINNYFI